MDDGRECSDAVKSMFVARPPMFTKELALTRLPLLLSRLVKNKKWLVEEKAVRGGTERS